MPFESSVPVDPGKLSAKMEEVREQVGFEPSTGDVFKAAFSQENTVGSLMLSQATMPGRPVPVEGYDPFEDIEGYQYFAKEFIQSASPEETQMIKNRIDKEFENREILESAGVTGFLAQVAAGALDPVYLPLALTGIGLAGRGATMARTFGRSAVVGAVSEIPAEVIKSQTQLTRTFEESVLNVGMSALFTGIVGTVGHAWSGRNKIIDKFRKNLADDVPEMALNVSEAVEGVPRVWDINEGLLIVDKERPFSLDRPKLPDVFYEPVNTGGIEKWGVSPMIRLHMADAPAANRFVFDMLETPIVAKGHKAGVALTPEGGSVETRVKAWDIHHAESVTAIEDLYTKYREGKGKIRRTLGSLVPGKRDYMTKKEFREEIGKAMIRGDQHAVPEVQTAAQTLRKNLFDPLKDEAIKLKMLPEDVKASTAASYLTRVYKHKKIIGRRDKWDSILRNWLLGERHSARQKLPGVIAEAEIHTGESYQTFQEPFEQVTAARSGIEKRTQKAVSDFTEQSTEVVRLREDIRTKQAEIENITSLMRQTVAAEKEIRSELQTAIKRFMKFRPDPRSTDIYGRIDDLNAKLQKIETDISRLEAVEAELKKEAGAQINSIFKASESGKKQKRQAHVIAFQRIERKLSKIRQQIAGKQNTIDSVVSDIEKTVQETKKLKPGDAVRAKELSVAISRLQKKIKPKSDDLSIYRQKIEDTFTNIKNMRKDLTNQIGIRNLVEEELKQIKKIGRQLKGHELGILKDDQIQGVINDITDNILGTARGRLNFDLIPGERGPMKERVLMIPDARIEEFLEKDIEVVSQYYLRTMAPDVELTRRFGSVGLEKELKEVSKEYDDLLKNAKTEKERIRIQKQKETALRDMEAVRDKLRGTYKVPENPDSFFVRAGRVLRDVNFMRMLGGMTLSALPDMARPVAVNGLKPVVKGLSSIALSPSRFNIARKQARKFAIGLDMVLNSRAMSLSDVADQYMRGNPFERGLSVASNAFSKLTLMSEWNAAMKQFSGVVTADRLLSESVNLLEGKIRKADLTRFVHSGISQDMGKRIAKQFQKHGDDGVIKLSNAHLWDDRQAYEVFKTAVLKDVDRTIVTPGVGEKPLWTEGEVGKLVFQFKTFAAAAHHKVLLSDLGFRDMAALNGFLLSVALGAATYGFKNYVADREIEVSPDKLIIESLDRSGVFGYFWDINNTISKVSRGTFGVERLMGVTTPMSRYVSRNGYGALFGPSFGTGADMYELIGSISSGEFTQKDLHTIRKMLPGQNLFYMRRLLNTLEKEMGRGLRK